MAEAEVQEEAAVKIRNLLKTWGVSAPNIKKFIDEEVTLESLPFLTEATFVELIAKKGPRDAFLHHWTAWKKVTAEKQVQQVAAVDDSDLFSDEDGGPPAKRTKQNDSCKAFLADVLAEPIVNDLHKFLKVSVPGLTILGYYAKNKELDHYSRDLLGQQAIYKALQDDYERSIKRTEFSDIADSIVELFPSESKLTWFDEVKKKNTTVLEGRLRFKYYSVRRSLYKANLISRKCIENDLAIETTEGLTGFDFSKLTEISNLTVNTPWQQIKECWNETREWRLKFRDAVPINDYISKFPILQHNLGWSLIAEDGVLAQPSLEFIDNFWGEYSEFLISLIQKKNKGFLKRQPESVSPEEETKQADLRFLSIIQNVTSLFKVRTLPKSPLASKSDKKCLRPSATETRDAFCLHLTDIALLEEKLDQRREKLGRFKYTLQPIPVIIGSPIKQCFIVLDNHRWEVDRPSTAVWGVVKLCFGLNASYPVEARHAYLYLQQTILKLNTPKDYKDDKGLRAFLAARVNDYDNFLKKK